MAGLDVSLHDLDVIAAPHSRVPRGKVGQGGWEAKWEAMVHTSLRQVLFLDADAYCVSSPCKMFEALDEAPLVFWSDLPANYDFVKWERVYPDGPRGVPAIQGGQWLLDRERAWPFVATVHWMNQHSDHWYQKQYGSGYGDQDCMRVALSAGQWPYKCLGDAPYIWPAFVCDYPKGKPAIVHRCNGKLFLDEEPQAQYGKIPYEERVFEWFREMKAKSRPMLPSKPASPEIS